MFMGFKCGFPEAFEIVVQEIIDPLFELFGFDEETVVAKDRVDDTQRGLRNVFVQEFLF